MTALPPICTVIPCYNREDTVAEAVRSVLDQEYDGDHRVICVDDRSTDRTMDRLHAIDDPRLTVVTSTRPNGPSGARNHGVALCDTPWVAFQDSDDIWLPGRLSRTVLAALEMEGAVASYCAMVVKEDAGPDTPVQARYPRPGTAPLSGDILPALAMTSFISTQMLTLRRDAFEAVGGFDEDLPVLVDWELMLRVAQIGPVAHVDETLVVQRMSPNSVTHSSPRRLKSQERILEKHRDLLGRYPEALAHHHHRIAGAHRRFGQFADGKPHAWAAAKAFPWRSKHLLHALYLQARVALG